MTVEIRITDNAAAVVAQLRSFPPRMQKAIARAMAVQNQQTVGYASERKMRQRGPKTLGVVTSRLRGSLGDWIRDKPPEIVGESVLSSIGTNVVYAGVHEFGFKGNVQVRSHSRRNFQYAGDGRKTFKTLDKKGRIVERTRKAKGVSATSTVRAHTRAMNMPERSYLRSSIQERVPQYSAAFSEAIVNAWNGGRP